LNYLVEFLLFFVKASERQNTTYTRMFWYKKRATDTTGVCSCCGMESV